MSDFVARMAARVVGEAPRAEPRLPALFEDADATGPAGLEVVEGEIEASPVGRRPDADAPGPREPSAASPPEPTAEIDADAPQRSPARRRPREAARHEEAMAIAARGLADIDIPVPSRPSADSLPDRPDVARPAEPAFAAVARPVAAAQAVLAPTPAAARSSESAFASEPPLVRVQIGRIEVRANLREEPVAPPAAREATSEPALSLSAYLRGERGAG